MWTTSCQAVKTNEDNNENIEGMQINNRKYNMKQINKQTIIMIQLENRK